MNRTAFLLPVALTLALSPALFGRADPAATPATEALYERLVNLTRLDAAAWGHQYALFRGVRADGSGWVNERGDMRYSDAKNIAGVHPAITGWDINEIWNTETWAAQVAQADALGAINTLSFHMDNPAGGDSWTTAIDLAEVMPGGVYHDDFKALWSEAADFIESLQREDGTPIPVILRPYHEMTGSWFWWGSLNTPEEYVALWQWTVEYLRDERGLHQILYAYATDKVSTESAYLARYPGDDYVDLLGLDYYRRDVDSNAGFVTAVQVLANVAAAKNMPAALTEVGAQSPDYSSGGMGATEVADWWLERVYTPLRENDLFDDIAFIAGWANWSIDQYHVPYPGDATAPGFAAFVRTDEILMLDHFNPDVRWTDFPGVGWIETSGYPWVYHPDHGWWYMSHPFSETSVQWYYDIRLKWLFTSAADYPHIYTLSEEWLYFHGGDGDTRHFWSHNASGNIARPRS